MKILLMLILTSGCVMKSQQSGSRKKISTNTDSNELYHEGSGVVINPTQEELLSVTGLKNYQTILETMSRLTKIPTTEPTIRASYQLLVSSLSMNNELTSYNDAVQKGAVNLAGEFCNKSFDVASSRDYLWMGMNFNAASLSANDKSALLTSLKENIMYGTASDSELTSQMAEISNALSELVATDSSLTARNLIFSGCVMALSSVNILLI